MSSSDLGGALSDLARALRPLDGRYMLIGGLAVVLRGFPRHTDDIDIAVLGEVSEGRDVSAPNVLLERPDLLEVEFVRTEWTQSTEADEFGRPKSGPRNTVTETQNAGPHSEPASDDSGCGGAKPWWADADELAVEMRFWIEVPGWRAP